MHLWKPFLDAITWYNVSCDEHKLKWWVGSGLFSWPDEEDIDKLSQANESWLADYREISVDETWDPPALVAETLIQDFEY